MTAAHPEATSAVFPEGLPTVALPSMAAYRAYRSLGAGRHTDQVPLIEGSPPRPARYPYQGKDIPRADFEADFYEKLYLESATWPAPGLGLTRASSPDPAPPHPPALPNPATSLALRRSHWLAADPVALPAAAALLLLRGRGAGVGNRFLRGFGVHGPQNASNAVPSPDPRGAGREPRSRARSAARRRAERSRAQPRKNPRPRAASREPPPTRRRALRGRRAARPAVPARWPLSRRRAPPAAAGSRASAPGS